MPSPAEPPLFRRERHTEAFRGGPSAHGLRQGETTLRGAADSVDDAAMRWLAAVLAVGMVGLLACGGGADVGEACDTPGNRDECVEDAVCDKLDDGDVQCLLLCVDKEDCPEDFDCNGVSGSSLKACHPKGV